METSHAPELQVTTPREDATIVCVGEPLAEIMFDAPAADASSLNVGCGGDAANIAVMAARAGARVRLCARVGDDAFGTLLLRRLADEGVDVSDGAIDRAAATGLYVNEAIEGQGHRFAYWRAGSAGSRVDEGDLTDALMQGAGLVVVTGITLALSASARRAARAATDAARRRGARVALVVNLRPALAPDPTVIADFAAGADVVLTGRDEARAVFGRDGAVALAEHLRGGPREVVVTDEDRPAQAVVDGELIEVPIPSVPVVNAAGAGDALAGAYLASRELGRDPRAALDLGVAVAAASVGRSGCVRSYPAAAAVRALADASIARAAR